LPLDGPAEPKNNRGIQCKGYLTFMGV